MDNKPRIGVLIPARNCQACVAEAIDSILRQSIQDWEVVIADDASTDMTRFIIDQYTDPRIRRFHNDVHQGVVHTRNKLLQHARGEFITWMDADDVSYENRLERLLEAFERQEELVLCGSNTIRLYRFSGERIITDYPLKHEDIRRFISERKGIPFTGASVAFRREILNEISGFRPFFNFGGEDPDFILRVSEKYRVGNISDVLYEVRYTRNSTSRRFTESAFLKLYLSQILFFLAEQRTQNSGLDGLMVGGDNEIFDRFIESLRQDFEKDVSVVYRRACLNKIYSQDYAFALLDALQAVKRNPAIIENYLLFPRLIGSLVKTIARILKRKLLSQYLAVS